MAQFKDGLTVKTATNDYELVGRPCELSAFSYVPTERTDPKERVYFNSDKQVRFKSQHCLHFVGGKTDQSTIFPTNTTMMPDNPDDYFIARL